MTYGIEFRKKVLEIKEKEGLTNLEVANRFGISERNISRWKKKLEPSRGRKKGATKVDMEALERDVKEYPDSYQHERGLRLGLARTTIKDSLKRLGITYKKNPEASKEVRRKAAVFPRENRKIHS